MFKTLKLCGVLLKITLLQLYFAVHTVSNHLNCSTVRRTALGMCTTVCTHTVTVHGPYENTQNLAPYKYNGEYCKWGINSNVSVFSCEIVASKYILEYPKLPRYQNILSMLHCCVYMPTISSKTPNMNLPD